MAQAELCAEARFHVGPVDGELRVAQRRLHVALGMHHERQAVVRAGGARIEPQHAAEQPVGVLVPELAEGQFGLQGHDLDVAPRQVGRQVVDRAGGGVELAPVDQLPHLGRRADTPPRRLGRNLPDECLQNTHP